MAKVYMMCGRICSGKSTYSGKLRKEHRAALLSVDEITLALFGQDAGDMHGHYVEMTEKYLYRKSLELIETDIDVVLDWGFWTRRERNFARDFYSSRGIAYEFRYIDIGIEEWHRRIEKRNQAVLEGAADAYFIDEGLASKAEGLFEAPGKDETDVLPAR